jgi:hypothetical protein
MSMKNLIYAVFALALLVPPESSSLHAQSIELNRQAILEVHNAITKPDDYRGKHSMEVRDPSPALGDNEPRMVLIKGVSLHNGSIEVTLAGDTAPDAPANLRGFVGIAFRIGSDRTRYECFYLRPKNGQSTDAVQRTHSSQYISMPEYGWDRLRTETPDKYESYVDIAPAEWIKAKIQISGKTASLFVDGATKPTLVVNDLKGTVDEGPIALWVGPGTIAHFTDLKITKATN